MRVQGPKSLNTAHLSSKEDGTETLKTGLANLKECSKVA